jgi:hypothetical protein
MYPATAASFQHDGLVVRHLQDGITSFGRSCATLSGLQRKPALVCCKMRELGPYSAIFQDQIGLQRTDCPTAMAVHPHFSLEGACAVRFQEAD